MLSGHLFPRSQLLIYCHLVESRSSKKLLPSTGGALSGEKTGKALYSRTDVLLQSGSFGDTWRYLKTFAVTIAPSGSHRAVRPPGLLTKR